MLPLLILLSDLSTLDALLKSQEYTELMEFQRPPPGFDLFRATNLGLGENRSSWILAHLFTSREPHQLGVRFLRAWADVVSESCGSAFPLAGVSWDRSTADVEWLTRENRRVDILIRLFREDDTLAGVIGVENKHWAQEQDEQVSHYQTEIAGTFPDVPSCVLFLTPSGKEPATGAKNDRCPWYSISWRTVITALRLAEHQSDGLVLGFLANFRTQLTDQLGLLDMSDDHSTLKERVLELFGNPEHRNAILLLEKLRPTGGQLLDQIRSTKPWSSFVFERNPRAEPYEAHWYPQDLESSFKRKDVSVSYSLLAGSQPWDSGVSVQVAVLAWCKGVKGKENLRPIQQMVTRNRPDEARWNGAEDLEKWYWSSWVPIWVGGEHILGGLLEEDAERLVQMLDDAHNRTHEWLRGNLEELGWLDPGCSASE